MFTEYHQHITDDGVQFVEDAHKAIQAAVKGLLQHHLKAYPDLATAAAAAAEAVLRTYQGPLCAAVQDVTHAYSNIVEPLHPEVCATVQPLHGTHPTSCICMNTYKLLNVHDCTLMRQVCGFMHQLVCMP
jgi:hypothetical protein